MHSITRDRAAWFCLLFAFGLVSQANPCRADGPADNRPESVRRIPKLGIEVPAADREKIQAGLKSLEASIAVLQKSNDPRVRSLLPDVLVYHKAVHDALKYQEFFDVKELAVAFDLLSEGQQRADALLKGQAPWTQATGPVVRGYVSKIDGSVQPYGLVIPPNYSGAGSSRWRLDFWFHGRGEVLSELNFINDRRRNKGLFTPEDTIVLHPYGRYCNAAKLAGEIDALEALAAVEQHYRVDHERICVRGFSMGGATAWHMAVHYPSRWVAANPGAGFSETPDFLKVFQKEELKPTWFERKLWHLYDCTDWAVNLHQCPTVAYSGEEDSQKQAADVMAAALAKEGIELTHIIGPKTKHSYEARAKVEVDRRLAEIARDGRQRVPRHIHFVTYTLRYAECAWLRIDGLEQHWEQARIDGELHINSNSISVKTRNVTAFTLQFAPGDATWNSIEPVTVKIDDAKLSGPKPGSDRSWSASFAREGKTWKLVPSPASGGPQNNGPNTPLVKRTGLQGPIDDAFLDAFVFVKPSGKCKSEAVERWTQAEMKFAIEQWRRHFRGEPRVKFDREIAAQDLDNMNVVLWGDAAANSIVAKIAAQIPIRETGNGYQLHGKNFSAEHHVPLAIYPNPLAPHRYVVLNSGFTFREFAHLNNARQVPKLPDWAIVDVRTPPNPLWPGEVVHAGFFDEHWLLKSTPDQ